MEDAVRCDMMWGRGEENVCEVRVVCKWFGPKQACGGVNMLLGRMQELFNEFVGVE